MLWWKIYFWLSAVLLVLGIMSYMMFPRLSARDVVDVAACILDMLALFAYIWKKNIFSAAVWKWYFWFNVAIVVFDVVYIYSNSFTLPDVLLSKGIEQNRSGYIPAILISLPFFYAIYQLGYPQKMKSISKKSTKKSKK